MRNTYLRMTLIFIGFFVLVGLACLSSGTADPTATVEPAVIQPQPTQEELVVVQPTSDKSPMGGQTQPDDEPAYEDTEERFSTDMPAYYTEEFDGDLTGYSYFLMNGDEDNMDLYTDSGRLIFDLQGTYQYVYVLYDEYTYDEVMVSLVADNRAKNSNNVSLICNYTERDGWYEFNIGNGGLYDILVYSELDGGYYTMQSGGSKNIKTGRAINEYTATCKGSKLALYINGVLEKEFEDTRYRLREGQVGFGVSSFDVLPILVEVDSFYIGTP